MHIPVKLKIFLLSIFVLFLVSIFISSCKNNDSNNPVVPPGGLMNYVGGYNTPGDSRGIKIASLNQTPYAFIADGGYGLQIINISNPTLPVLAGSYNTVGFAYHVELSSVNGTSFAFVSDGAGGMVVINISIPSNPHISNGISFADDVIICSSVSGNYLFIAGFNDKVYIYDISNLPNSLTQIAIYNAHDRINHIEVSNGIAYLAEVNLGLEIFNVTVPSAPVFLSGIDTPGDAKSLKIGSHYAFVADGDAGLTVIDIINPSNPLFVSNNKSGGTYMGICYTNTTTQPQVYTAEYSFGVESYDVSNIPEPKATEYYDTPGYSYDLIFNAGMVYVADGQNGLMILQYK